MSVTSIRLALTWNCLKGRGVVYVVTQFMHKIYALRCHIIMHHGNLVFIVILVEIAKIIVVNYMEFDHGSWSFLVSLKSSSILNILIRG